MLKKWKWFSVNIYGLVVDRWCCPLRINSLFLALKQSAICDRSNWSKTVDEGKEHWESNWYTRDSGSAHANVAWINISTACSRKVFRQGNIFELLSKPHFWVKGRVLYSVSVTNNEMACEHLWVLRASGEQSARIGKQNDPARGVWYKSVKKVNLSKSSASAPQTRDCSQVGNAGRVLLILLI